MIHNLQRVEASGQALYAKREARQPQNVGHIVQGRLHWLATQPMRDELERVLDYPQLKPRLSHHSLSAETVLAAFDAWVSPRPVAPKAIYTCKDPDDQKFIDLAVAHQAALLSKDKAVLVMRKRLLKLGVALSLPPQS